MRNSKKNIKKNFLFESGNKIKKLNYKNFSGYIFRYKSGFCRYKSGFYRYKSGTIGY